MNQTKPNQGRLGAVNLFPFFKCGLKSVNKRLYSRYHADTDVKSTNQPTNQPKTTPDVIVFVMRLIVAEVNDTVHGWDYW